MYYDNFDNLPLEDKMLVRLQENGARYADSINRFGSMVSIDNGSYRFKEDLFQYCFINRYGEIEWIDEKINDIGKKWIQKWIDSEDWQQK